MCIIIYNRDGAALDKAALQVAFSNNPDGFGIMYHDGVALQRFFGHVDNERQRALGRSSVGLTPAAARKALFARLWRKLQDLEGIPGVAIHLRKVTRGANNVAQCHPFQVTNVDQGDATDLYMMHNGTFAGFKRHATQSDTKLFARKMRLIMRYENKSFVEALEQMTESHIKTTEVPNRVLFMDDAGSVTIDGLEHGKWSDDGVWYSNEYSFDPEHRTRGVAPKQINGYANPYRFDAPEEKTPTCA